MTPENLCAMCEDPTPADRGLLCASHRAEDNAIHDRLVDDARKCASCQSDMACIHPCLKDVK